MTGRFGNGSGRRTTWWALICCLLAAGPLLAEEPPAKKPDSLARLVPATAGLCIEADDLAGALARLQSGALAKRIGQNPQISAQIAQGLGKLSAARAVFRAQLGISEDPASGLLGGQLLLAVWPAAATGADGTGLLVLRSEHEKLLQRVADKIVERQEKSGRLEPPLKIASEGRTVEAHAIRINRAGGKAYLAVVGHHAVVSTDSQVLVHVLASLIEAPHERVLADLPAYQAARERLNPEASVRLFFNPRRWDEQMRARPRPQSGRQALVHDAIAGLWEASDYLAASLEAADDLKFEAFLACPQSRLHEPLKSVISGLSGPSQLAARLPPKCLAAAAGRLDLGRTYHRLIDSQATLHTRYAIELPKSLDHAAVVALAGCLGPECGLAIFAPPEAETAGGRAVRWLVGLETQNIEPGATGPATTAWLLPWLRETVRVASAAAKADNEPGPQVSIVQRDGIEVTSISGLRQLPAGESLQIAAQQPWLWLSTSKELASQAARGPAAPASANRRYLALHHPRFTATSDFLLVDLAEIRHAADVWAATHSETATTGRGFILPGKIAELARLTNLADGLLLEVQCDAAGTAVALHVACD